MKFCVYFFDKITPIVLHGIYLRLRKIDHTLRSFQTATNYRIVFRPFISSACRALYTFVNSAISMLKSRSLANIYL